MRVPSSQQDTPRSMNVPGLGRGSNLRPSSEMLPMGQQGTPETDVIDKWFEDLQNYEATLGTYSFFIVLNRVINVSQRRWQLRHLIKTLKRN